MLDDLDNIEKKTLIKGQCGHFHPEDECEVVIVKFVKGKNCNLTETPVAPTRDFAPVKQQQFEELPPEVVVIDTKKPRSIIPPGIASMMFSPGDPGFETNGAKETRKV